MADIYLDNGELAPTMFGDIATVDGDDEILQMAIHSIRTVLGENQFHTYIGNKIYERRLKVMDNDADTILHDCSTAVMQDDRVQQVVEMKVYRDDTDRHNLDIEFTLTTVSGSTISSTVQIQI